MKLPVKNRFRKHTECHFKASPSYDPRVRDCLCADKYADPKLSNFYA